MNELRAAILSGNGVRPATPVAAKRTKADPEKKGSLTAIAVKREESRLHNQRREERHRDLIQSATVYFRRRKHQAGVINVSSGGIMVDCSIEPRIGEIVEIQFADCNRTRCAVRWMRDGRIGLEFGQETEIQGSVRIRDFIVARLRGEEIVSTSPGEHSSSDRAPRHGLLWVGTLHCNHDSIPVRLRNISAEGAMLETSVKFPVGAEVLLDLDDAGTTFARVRWADDGQMGVKFDTRFDLRKLVKARQAPANNSHMVKPKYLQSETSPDSPFAMWDKFTPEDLAAS
jgi:hypothetical protein